MAVNQPQALRYQKNSDQVAVVNRSIVGTPSDVSATPPTTAPVTVAAGGVVHPPVFIPGGPIQPAR